MLHVAAPLGLLALASLVVPIALHLIRRPRRTVHVGSLRFLAGQRRRLDSIRWRERLLLTVRCLLLAALALLIAGASWRPNDTTPARWLLLTPGAVLDPAQQEEWNRLSTAGFAPHHLAPGFGSAKSTPATAHAGYDAWSLLRELDSRLPAGSQAHVFGPTPAEWFAGARPELSRLQVTWTRTTAAVLPLSPVPSASRTATRIAVIAGPERAEDARYLRAAMAAAGAIETRANPDWIFLLGTAELPADFSVPFKEGTVLVRDAADTLAARVVNRTFPAATSSIHLRQRVPLAHGTPLLTDSTGEPLLIERRTGSRREWQWALRFHPDWTDWPTGGAFPAWWRDHWAPRPATGLSLAPEQAAPGFNASSAIPTPFANPARGIDLRPFCWWLALALFVLEFWLRRRRPTTPPA